MTGRDSRKVGRGRNKFQREILLSFSRTRHVPRFPEEKVSSLPVPSNFLGDRMWQLSPTEPLSSLRCSHPCPLQRLRRDGPTPHLRGGLFLNHNEYLGIRLLISTRLSILGKARVSNESLEFPYRRSLPPFEEQGPP